MSWTIGFRTKGSQENWRYTLFYATEDEAEGVKDDWEGQPANAKIEFRVIEVPGHEPEPEPLEPVAEAES